MDCCIGVFFLIAGFALIITALVMKGIPLGATRILPRTPACVLGLILLMPMCCGVGGAGSYLAYKSGQFIFEQANANKGKTLSPREQEAMQLAIQQQIQAETNGPVRIFYFVIWGLTIVLALIVALTSIEPRTPAIEAPPTDYGFRAPPPPDGGYKPRDF